MVQIHILDQQSDEILDSTTVFSNDKHYEDIKGLETFVFSIPPKSRLSRYVTNRNRAIIPVDDGLFREFIINESRQLENEKEVYTSASYNELKKAEPISPITLQGSTVDTAMDYILRNTGWVRGITDYSGTRRVEFDDYIEPYSALNKISNVDTFNLELRFRVEINGNKITRLVDMLKYSGEWRGKEIISGKDLISAIRKENTGDVATALYGIGPIKEDGTRDVVIVKNDEARQVWGRKGRHLWDIYSPTTEDIDMSKSRLQQLTEMELQKRISAHVTYEIEGVDIEHVMGREHEKVRLGDSARIKATEYNPPIYLDSRIIAREGSIRNKSQKKYILGEFVERTEEDIRKNLKLLEKQIARKISEAQLINYAEKIIPEQATPPDPNEHPKWVDTSEDPPQLKLWDGTNWNAVKGEKGEPGEDGTDGPQGPKGDKGDNGYTPIKGVDYFDGVPGQDGADGEDGTSAYLWVRWSQNENGNPMTSDPTNAKYVGIATTTTASAPPSYTAYQWSKFVGDDGIPGENGTDGRTSYLHVKYSNDGGQTFTENDGESVGDWIGTYVDFVQEDSNDVSDYTWNKVKGDDGESSYSFVAYANSPDGTVGFSTTDSEDKDYIGTFTHTQSGGRNLIFNSAMDSLVGWTPNGYSTIKMEEGFIKNELTATTSTPGIRARERISLEKGLYTLTVRLNTDNFSTFTRMYLIGDPSGQFSVLIPKLPGWNTISVSFEIEEDRSGDLFYILTGGPKIGDYVLYDWIKLEKGKTPTPWSPAPEDLAQDPTNYNWQRTKGEPGERGLQGLQGPTGNTGIQGPKGADGLHSYTHIAYADTEIGGGFSQSPNGKAYIGMYVDFIEEDSSTPSKYKWSLVKGADGSQGVQGPKGADGQTPYFHTAWANNSTGTSGFSTDVSANKLYIGTYTDFTQDDSEDPSKYSWTKIKGEDGPKGDKGDTGSKGDQGPAGKDGIAHMGTSPPSNPAINGTWFETDSAGKVIAIKKWTGSAWDEATIDEMVLSVAKLSALSADLGDVTAGNINGVTITGSQFIHEYVDIYGKRYNARFEYGGLYLTEILSNGLESPLVTSFQKDRMNMAEDFTIYNGGNVFEVQAIDLKFKKSGAGIDEPSRSVLVDQEDGWHTVTSPTSTGWTNVSGYGPMRYALNKIGEVMLSGFISGSGISNINIFTLPTGFRPNTNRVFPGYTSSGKVIRLEITSAGLVRALNYVAGDGFLSLDNVRFNRF